MTIKKRNETDRLWLSKTLALPVALAGQTTALVGIRGSGKTNTGGVIAEELLDRHQPIVVLDPTNAWWGIRSGYPVFIFGGPHGDLPLAETDGKVLAEFVVTEQVSIVLSMRHLRKSAQRRFVTDFCEELFHLKGKDEHRTPLTVFIDEAPLFVPQRVMGDVARTVGAVEDLIARGRLSGFGVVLISQRPATLNKDVLTQADTIITHRLTSPQDRKALKEWIEENATLAQQREVLQSLAELPTGDAWVWAPLLGVIKRAHIRKRRTFDSSASPVAGTSATPKRFVEIDLEKLRGRLAETATQAKANDPKALKQRVHALERELLARQAPTAAPTVEVSVLTAADRELLAKASTSVEGATAAIVASIDQAADHMADALGQVRRVVGDMSRAVADVQAVSASIRERPNAHGHVVRARLVAPSTRPPRREPVGETSFGKCERAILAVLSQHPDGCTLGKLTLLSGYRASGGFRNALSTLRTAGLLDGANTATMRVTQAGLDTLGDVDPLPAGDALLDYWQQHRSFGSMERAILGALRDGSARTIDELAAAGGYQVSGGFRNALSKLRTAGVLVGKNTEPMRLSEVLA